MLSAIFSKNRDDYYLSPKLFLTRFPR